MGFDEANPFTLDVQLFSDDFKSLLFYYFRRLKNPKKMKSYSYNHYAVYFHKFESKQMIHAFLLKKYKIIHFIIIQKFIVKLEYLKIKTDIGKLA